MSHENPRLHDLQLLGALGLQNFSTQVLLRCSSSIVMLIWTRFTGKQTPAAEFSNNILFEHPLERVLKAMKLSEPFYRKNYKAWRIAPSQALRSIRRIIVAQSNRCEDHLFGHEISSGIEKLQLLTVKKEMYDQYRDPMSILTNKGVSCDE